MNLYYARYMLNVVVRDFGGRQEQMKNAPLTLYRYPGKFADLTETSGRKKSIFYVFALSLSLPSSFESKISTVKKKGKCVRRIASLPPHIFLFRPPFYVMVYTFSSPVHISSPFFLPTTVLRCLQMTSGDFSF